MTPEQVADGVYITTSSRYLTTSVIVAGPGGECLLIDPALTPGELAGLAGWLAGTGLRVTAGFATHPHWDHVLWSAAFGASVPRYATARAVRQVAVSRAELLAELQAQAPGHDLAAVARLTPLPGAGRQLPWTGPAALVLAHAGHAPGHAALFLPETGVLVAGDMLSDVEIPLLDLASDAPLESYRAGLRLLAGVAGVRCLIPGHGHVGAAGALAERAAADAAYLELLEAGGGEGDRRLGAPGAQWLRDEHARQCAQLTGPARGGRPG